MEIRQAHTSISETLEVGCFDFPAVRRCVAEAKVIGDNDEKVWLFHLQRQCFQKTLEISAEVYSGKQGVHWRFRQQNVFSTLQGSFHTYRCTYIP